MTVVPHASLRQLQAIYRERWQQHGLSPQSLGWTKGKQHIRFDVLLSALQCEGKSYLDVGCGFGDLNTTLREHCLHYRYLGLDMVPEFIEQGQQLYAAPGINFRLGDFLSSDFSESFDVVIASGIFAFQLSEMDNYDYITAVLRRMLELCTEAVTVDFLSDRVNFRRDGTFYTNPARMLDVALSLTRNVRLRHDYMPFEFALTLFKDDTFLNQDTVFNHYKNEGTTH